MIPIKIFKISNHWIDFLSNQIFLKETDQIFELKDIT